MPYPYDPDVSAEDDEARSAIKRYWDFESGHLDARVDGFFEFARTALHDTEASMLPNWRQT